jgi:hypothetical protein
MAASARVQSFEGSSLDFGAQTTDELARIAKPGATGLAR